MLIEINPQNPEPRKIRRVVDALERGECIAYPTDTCYGFGCDLMNRKAIEALYKIKGMAANHELSFICRDLGDVARYAVMHDHEYRIMKQHLPGPYCFIMDSTREVPKVVQSARKQVGVRIPKIRSPSRWCASLAVRSSARPLDVPVARRTSTRGKSISTSKAWDSWWMVELAVKPQPPSST